MQYGLMNKIYGIFFYSACKKGLKEQVSKTKEIKQRILAEYRAINLRAKDIGPKNKLMSAYMMAAYFIAMNRTTGLTPDENYHIFEKGLSQSKLFRSMLGNADGYLTEKKWAGRKEWDERTHRKEYENDWVVTVIKGNGDFELGYDYEECGVCKLCRDEDCFELAKYLCRLDFLMADMMGMKLERTQTIAEGHKKCDFRYSYKTEKHLGIGGCMAVKVKDLSTEQIDRICRAIGDSFYDHDYGTREKGIAKYITDREMMFLYMRAIFVAGVKSGTVYTTSEWGEGYIMLSGSKWEKMKLGPAVVMLRDMIKALGGFRNAVQFMKKIKAGGIPLDEKLKKEKKDFLKVEMLVVLKEYQGQGNMRKLLEIAYEKADEYGVPCVLDTDAKNKLDKYCHLGMKHVATRKLAEDCYLYDLRRENS